MKMTDQEKTRFFGEIQAALVGYKGIHVSVEALEIFFENTEPENTKLNTLLKSYRSATEHPDFSLIAQVQECVFDFPGIVFSFTDETYCLDCSSDERANETDVWDWLLQVEVDILFALKINALVGHIYTEKWSQILNGRNIKEVMNLLYQNNVVNSAFPPSMFSKHHCEFFIHDGYERFNWVQGIIDFYLPQIEKIETNLKLKQNLSGDKAILKRTKI
ncbi:TPA: hypothetical protein QDB51_003488 [Burkholderia vietnamiensis]|nr:hypothetical protein [Burkholderia vietnamiensis]